VNPEAKASGFVFGYNLATGAHPASDRFLASGDRQVAGGLRIVTGRLTPAARHGTGTPFAANARAEYDFQRHEEGFTMSLRSGLGVLALTALFLVTLAGKSPAAGPDAKDVKAILDKAVAYLKKTQEKDGSWSAKQTGPGVTALVVAGLLRAGVPADDPVVAKGLEYLEKSIQKDGGIYNKMLANYTTSVGIMAFAEANKGGKYDAILKNATAFLKGLQNPDADPKDPKGGGLGYDSKSRPDVSNTQFFIDAMIAAGIPKDDPALQKALKFMGRAQNLPGETNEQPWAAKTSDDDRGGLTYVPLDTDDNKHKTPNGGLRSLGAMTYAGLKSFLYAGVGPNDPRVKAAVDWIKRHYTLEENPGMGQAGLFYYYHTFGKAMAALGQDTFEDSKGGKHDWRKELFEAIQKHQKEDGSFVNPGDRAFGEADPNLSTAFAILALSYTKGK
jgi:squalene-hopene/tetraprenyl-beta-curcumene cyclase